MSDPRDEPIILSVTLHPDTRDRTGSRFHAMTQDGFNCYVSVPGLGLLIFTATTNRGYETTVRPYMQAFRDALDAALLSF